MQGFQQQPDMLNVGPPPPLRRSDGMEDINIHHWMNNALEGFPPGYDHDSIPARLNRIEATVDNIESLIRYNKSVKGVWPKFVNIGGFNITCNMRARSHPLDLGDTPVIRAMRSCKEMMEVGLVPTYKALRACHFGSVTAKEVLAQLDQEQQQAQADEPAGPQAEAPMNVFQPYPPFPPLIIK